MNAKKAIQHLLTARRLSLLCASAAASDYHDARVEISTTLGVDVDNELSLAIDELSAEAEETAQEGDAS